MRTILRVFGLVSLASLLVVLEGCAGHFGGTKRLSNADLTLCSFGSVNGELAPCG